MALCCARILPSVSDPLPPVNPTPAMVALDPNSGAVPVVNTDVGHVGQAPFQDVSAGPTGLGARWHIPVTTDVQFNYVTIRLQGAGGGGGGGGTNGGDPARDAGGGGGGGGGALAEYTFLITPAMRDVYLTGYIGVGQPGGAGANFVGVPGLEGADGVGSPPDDPGALAIANIMTTFDPGQFGQPAAVATTGEGGQGGVFAVNTSQPASDGGDGGRVIADPLWTEYPGGSGSRNRANLSYVNPGSRAATFGAAGGGGGGSAQAGVEDALGTFLQYGNFGGAGVGSISGGIGSLFPPSDGTDSPVPTVASASYSGGGGGGHAGEDQVPFANVHTKGGNGGLWGAGGGGGGGVEEGQASDGGDGADGIVVVIFS